MSAKELFGLMVEPSYLPELRRLLGDGKTITEAARRVGVSKSTAHRVIARFGMAGRRRRMKPRLNARQERRMSAMLADGISLRRAAREHGVTWNVAKRLSGEIPDDEAPLAIQSVKKRFCPGCSSYVITSPCLICAARKRREESGSLQTQVA